MNVLLRILLSIALMFAMTLPVFQRQLSGIQSAEDMVESYLNDWSGGAYDYVKKSADILKKTIEKKQKQEHIAEFDNLLLNGYGFGINTLGAVKMTYGNFRYDIYNPVPILASCILLVSLLQIFMMPAFFKHGNGILGLINILLLLALLGNTIGDQNYDGVLTGSIIFILIQSAYLVTFFIKKGKIKASLRENHEL
jgi:hypothetical protein